MESILGSALIKITELVGGKLFDALASRKRKHRKALLVLFSAFKGLGTIIESLIADLSTDAEAIWDNTWHIQDTANEMRPLLEHVRKSLQTLAPEFEIMAGDAVSLIEQSRRRDITLVYDIVSRGGGDYDASDAVKAQRLRDVLEEARAARDAVKHFVQRSYDWATLHES